MCPGGLPGIKEESRLFFNLKFRMLGKKINDGLLVFLWGKRAGGIDQAASGPKHDGGLRQDFQLAIMAK